MDLRYFLLGASLVIGLLLSLFGGIFFVIIFALLWIDKIIFEMIKVPRFIGMEFVTLSMVVIGITQGYVFGFVYAIIVIPILEGIRQLLVPKDDGWPLFVPTVSHVADGLTAAIAYFLKSSSLIIIFIEALSVKYAIHLIKDRLAISDKPPDVISPIINFIFKPRPRILWPSGH